MKNSIKILRLGTLIMTAFLYVNISIGAAPPDLYKEDDMCSRYIPGCTEIVIKCRETGTEICRASDQIPCEEKCAIF
ncbi:hypothetical protein ACV07N_01065 [Roseivirga echinicomitans]